MNKYYAHQSDRVQAVLYRVFAWMFFALFLTGITSYYVSQTAAIRDILLKNSLVFIGLFIAQIALVVYLSTRIFQIKQFTAFALFSLYSVLTGVTLSVIFLVYETGSIVSTFFVASAMFASMAIYGAVTKADLTGIGSFLGMALWGLILALIINLFLQSSMFDLVAAMIGVVIFAGLTAYDIQKIKMIAERADLSDKAVVSVALMASLTLYLDFINLFLSLLRVMGNRRR